MNKIQEKLAKRLLYLPLDVHDKVLLWLTYKNLKPVSEICADRRRKAELIRKIRDKKFRNSYISTYNPNSPNSKRIKKWIHDASMFIATEKSGDISWHISKNKTKAFHSAKIIHLFDYQHEIEKGSLFGFPKKSVEAYAHNQTSKTKSLIPMVGTGSLKYDHPYLKNKYFTPYVFYNTCQNSITKDSQIAKKWADTIRRDIPLLAKWFEKQEKSKIKNRL